MDHHFKQSLRLQALKLKQCRCYPDSSVQLTAPSGAGNKWLFKTSSSLPFHLLPVAPSSRRDRSGHTWVFPVLPRASHCLPVPALSTLPPADWFSHGPHFSFWSPASKPPMPLVGNHIPPKSPWSCLPVSSPVRDQTTHTPSPTTLTPHATPLSTGDTSPGICFPTFLFIKLDLSFRLSSNPTFSMKVLPNIPVHKELSLRIPPVYFLSRDIICSFKLALLSLVVIHAIDTPV